jgi:DNA-binding protein HU-beta
MYTKQDLIKHLSEDNGSGAAFSTKADAEKAISSVIDGIKALSSDESNEGLNLTGFGAFKRVTRAARQGRNPATGEVIQIKESKSVNFKLSKPFKDSLNS